MSITAAGTASPRWWVPGDWNGFFGLFTNVLLNVIVITGLCLGVVKLPDDIVFGRILPALGIALPIGNLYYAYLAWRLAKKEGRDSVTAMPYGPSVPHMFIVVFLIMLPTYLKTKDPVLAWQAGLAWCLVIGIIVLLGAFVGPTVRKFTPRAAMLGTLAGISIAFISMRPAFQGWEVPWLFFLSLAIVLISWTGNVRLPGGIPGGLAAVAVGTVLAWAATALHLTELMQGDAVVTALHQFGLRPPIPSGDFVKGLGDIGPLLVTAVPLGIYNFTEGMNNVESAAAAGDDYNLRQILLADGIGAVVGACLGSPFPPAVYIGHPGWKAVGGRIGDRWGHRARLLPRLDRSVIGGDPAGVDPADPAVHRPCYRRAIVSGDAGAACACSRAGAAAEHRCLGSDPGRRRPHRRRHLGIASRIRQAWRHRGRLSRHGTVGRRRGTGRHDPGRDCGVHHRPAI